MVKQTSACYSRQSGVALIALLSAIVVMGVLLASVGEVWKTTAQREREEELLFVGVQIRNAIQSYKDKSPAGIREYPRSLSDLLEDRRFPTPVRHLRKLYRDPLTNSNDWGLLQMGDRIIGIYSLSESKPLKEANFPEGLASFSGSTSYRQWVFVVTN